MATRAIIRIKDLRGDFLWIYRHFDGYPEVNGLQLFEFLKDEKCFEIEETVFRLIAYLKFENAVDEDKPFYKEWGNFRIFKPDSVCKTDEELIDEYGVEYVYSVAPTDDGWKISYTKYNYKDENERHTITEEDVQVYRARVAKWQEDFKNLV